MRIFSRTGRETRGPQTSGQARGQEACKEVVRARVHRHAVAAAPRETPAQAREKAGLEGEESREEADRYEEVARQEEVARPQEKEVVA